MLVAPIDAVVAGNAGRRRAVGRAEPAEDAAVVARGYAAPAPAGARGADEVEMRGEAQEHPLEKIVVDGVNRGRRRRFPPGILAAAAPHGDTAKDLCVTLGLG